MNEPGDRMRCSVPSCRRRGNVPPGWYTILVATTNPRVQVTVDQELAQALDAVDAHPATKSRLVRDMALRGARAAQEERRWAIDYLGKIAKGEVDYDFDALREVLEMRDEHLR